MVYLRSNFFGGLCKTFLFLQECRFGLSRSSRVIGFGTNRKRVCDFLLVRYSNFGSILHRFRDIAGFLCSWPTPILPRFWGYSPWTRSPMLRSTWAGTLSYSAVELFSKYSNLCKSYLNVTNGQNDRQTDRRIVASPRSA